MPGIFLSSIHKEGKDEILPPSPSKEDQSLPEEKGLRFLQLHKKKAVLIVLFLLFLFFKDWTGPADVFDVPTTHVDFVGREKQLTFLHRQLLKKKDQRKINLIAICGEGGIGKTELAIAFANSHLKDFSFIGWIDASNEEALHRSYVGMGDLLGIEEEHPERLREKIHRKLAKCKRKPWLLIFDDVRSHSFDLPKSQGAILMTCRDKSICPPNAVLELKKSPQEAMLLLSKLTKETESESMHQLTKKLDYLPLMMNIVGHYIAETPGINISNYSEIVSSIMETENSPLKKVEFRKRYPRSLVETYLITLQLLEKKHPLSLEFLKEAIFLHPKQIPLEFLTHWLASISHQLCWKSEHSVFSKRQEVFEGKVCKPFQEKFLDAAEKQMLQAFPESGEKCGLEKKDPHELSQRTLLKGEILRELQNHSLIRLDAKTESFSIHDLLHQALILEFKDEEKISKSLQTLAQLDCVQCYNPTQKDTIRSFQAILPHCIAVLDHVKKPNLIAVRLALVVARYFLETKQHLEKAQKYLTLSKQWTEDANHPIKGRILFLNGVLKFRESSRQKEEREKKKKASEALAFFHEALAIYQDLDCDELYQSIEQNPSKCFKEYQRAICIQYQGQILRVLGRLDEAEKRLQQALEAFQEISKEKDHFDMARIVREQGIIFGEKGEYEKAIQKIKEAISMQKQIYENAFSSHPTVAATYRLLGDLYLKNKEFCKSDKAYEKAIKINQMAYQSKTHPYLVYLYKKRSEALYSQGKISLARKMEKTSQKIQMLLKESA